MTSTSALLTAALQPVLAGTAFDEVQGGDSPGRSAHLTWCTASATFRARHPSATEAFDDHHPDGCTDLCIYVEDGILDRASIEGMSIDDDLVGAPIEEVLPVLVARIGEVLGRDG